MKICHVPMMPTTPTVGVTVSWKHMYIYIYICIYISSVSNRLFKDVYVHACECMNILKGLFEIKLHQLR